jgi:hypothetical protein
MDDSDELPATLEGCHSLIRDLRFELRQKTRLIKSVMGYDPTNTAQVTAYQQGFTEAVSKVDHEAIEAELAAEDAMRLARRQARQKKPG